ncbi:MAG: hypothetical protein MHM6MM_001817 [Cercozoa sp. M6MM]
MTAPVSLDSQDAALELGVEHTVRLYLQQQRQQGVPEQQAVEQCVQQLQDSFVDRRERIAQGMRALNAIGRPHATEVQKKIETALMNDVVAKFDIEFADQWASEQPEIPAWLRTLACSKNADSFRNAISRKTRGSSPFLTLFDSLVGSSGSEFKPAKRSQRRERLVGETAVAPTAAAVEDADLNDIGVEADNEEAMQQEEEADDLWD